MKIISQIYFLFVVCLITLPDPCLASSPRQLFIPASEEDSFFEREMELDSVQTSELSTPLRPESIPFRSDDGPIRVAIANVPPAPLEAEGEIGTIPDPIEPVNRALFAFNDKFYFWVLKPVAQGYKTVAPEVVRLCIRNFFSHVATPVRLANCLLQADLKCAGTETARFFINTAIGFAGFFDSAKTGFNLEKQDRDFGQTLGIYGMRSVFYIDWPILGPSSLRDTIGFVGDLALDPRTYVFNAPWTYVVSGSRSLEVVNNTSFKIGEYEDLKKAALDPYVALRDAYFQYREHKIRNR